MSDNIRNIALARNISGSFVVKGAALLVSFLSTPAFISYFNDNVVLGAWFTSIAISNWIISFDLGIGNGLRNHLVKAFANGDKLLQQRLISSAYFVLGGITVLACLFGFLLLGQFSWGPILGVHHGEVSDSSLLFAVRVLFLGTMVQFVLKLITSILYALEKTAVSSSIALVSSVLLLLFVLIPNDCSMNGKLSALALAQVFSVNAPLAVASIAVFATSLRGQAPRLRCVDLTSAKMVAGLGGIFFMVQIALLVVNSTNELIIGLFCGAEFVVDYQIYYKLFFLIVSIFTLVVQPMWSSMGRAYEEGDIGWMRSKYRLFNQISIGGSFLCVLLSLTMPVIVRLWLGDGVIEVRWDCCCVFSALAVEMLFINSSTCVANATSQLKTQVIFSLFAAIAKFPAAIVCLSILPSWISVVLANFIVLVPLLVAQVFATKRFFRSGSDR